MNLVPPVTIGQDGSLTESPCTGDRNMQLVQIRHINTALTCWC